MWLMYWAFVVPHSTLFRNPRRLPALTHSVFLYASLPASQSTHGVQETHFSVSLPSAHMCATARGIWVSVELIWQHDCLMTLQLSLLGTSASVFWLWAHKPSPKCVCSALASRTSHAAVLPELFTGDWIGDCWYCVLPGVLVG